MTFTKSIGSLGVKLLEGCRQQKTFECDNLDRFSPIMATGTSERIRAIAQSNCRATIMARWFFRHIATSKVIFSFGKRVEPLPQQTVQIDHK